MKFTRFLPPALLSLLMLSGASCTSKKTQAEESSENKDTAWVGQSITSSTFKLNTEKEMDKETEKGLFAGVSGEYTGAIGSNIIMAGGCNFPEDPLGKDSKKVFYHGIYKILFNSDGGYDLEKIGTLPPACAYGGAVSLPQGILLIGGSDGTKSYADVNLASIDADGNAVVTPCPSLPVTLDNFYACAIDGVVYAGGGNANGVPSNAFYMLDTNDMSKGWTELPSFPGNPRVQPVMAAGIDSKGDKNIYLWGGFAGKGEGREATLNTDGCRFNIKDKEWHHLEAPKGENGEEISLGGGCAATLPDGLIVAAGGVNKDVFLNALRNQAPDYLEHPIEWYRFNDNILVFDPKTETWKVVAQNKEAARAGAGMVVTPDKEILLIGGELKPRIRTAEIFRFKLD